MPTPALVLYPSSTTYPGPFDPTEDAPEQELINTFIARNGLPAVAAPPGSPNAGAAVIR